jgi:4-hydroxythreonine-4-phosphate dehydrogenase
MTKPLLAITMGDPAGVGPEAIVGAWRSEQVHEAARPFVVGHPAILQRAARLIDPQIAVREIQAPSEAESNSRLLCCLKTSTDALLDLPPALPDPRGGQAAYDALVCAATLALDRQIAGLVTAPLHKGALWLAGHHYPGHTELLAELCGVGNYAMMLYLPPCDAIRSSSGLSIVHVTLHMALRDVFAALTIDEIVAKTELIDGFVRKLGVRQPRLGVCALNPHAGEDGLFGDEEARVIAPAIARAKASGYDVQGPYPADTLIARARDGDFDGIVAMYHDQGHIAIKLLAMHHAVNVTLGLPIIRTSVAHGTAFDKAWQGRVESSGMVAAVLTAARLAAGTTHTEARMPSK